MPVFTNTERLALAGLRAGPVRGGRGPESRRPRQRHPAMTQAVAWVVPRVHAGLGWAPDER